MLLGYPDHAWDGLGRAWVTLKIAKNDFSGYFSENALRMA
ncbi:hypothetical protein T11_17035 [Trichinella zimbabwensis]|uniref:Uncharacterized protein n=1 Tax=Trichinella zimbabwensis TaxID=268475 RepID=A0A0V1F3S3_9BILA|nr:hypothetical protein T11_17035 [Trichinella zimbabwensis]